MPFRKRSKSLDNFDLQDEIVLKPQRVVSFKLFAQEQRSRLTTLYPFLTQEQICLKVKERWNRMEEESKQNYTKAVLYATPSRKNASPPKLLKTDIANLPSKKKIVNSKTKVTEWLNDLKQTKDGKKTYDTSSYVLQYDVPTVIDPTPSKQPGILKTGCSEKKENEKSGKSRRRSRVSFETNAEIQEKKITESEEKKKTKTRLESKFTTINDVFNFEEKPVNEDTEKKRKLNSKIKSVNLKEVTSKKVEGGVFEEKKEDELFTSPKMVKDSIQEISEAPKKRKSARKKGNSGLKKKDIASCKAKQMKTSKKSNDENLNNNRSSIVSDVFGKKTWAACTYSKRFTPEKSKKNKESKVDLFTERKGGAIVGPVVSQEDDSNSIQSNDFIRNRRGLIVGPVGFSYDDMEDEPESENEVDMNSEHQLQKGDKVNTVGKKKLKFSSDKKSQQETTSCQKKVIKKQESSGKKMTAPNISSKYDFEDVSDDKYASKVRKQKDTIEIEDCASRLTKSKVIADIDETPNIESENDSQESGSFPYQSRLVSMCNDFTVEKPVSPIISDAGDNSLSNVSEERSSPLRPPAGGNPILMKVLLKMKQITSPNILDLGDGESLKLSPTLSGISELSSMSTRSTAMRDIDASCNLSTAQQQKTKKCPKQQTKSNASKRRSSKSGQNFLCSMFDDLTPPELRKKSQRRLVSSNKRQEKNNFSDMFEDNDIFI